MRTKKMVMTALFAAFVCVATMAIRIPSGSSGGYVNMGDGVVLLSAYILGPLCGGLAAGIGSFLADIFAGYAVFAVPTLIIKFLMAFVSGLLFLEVFKKKKGLSLIACSVVGQIIMTVGYFITEIWMTGSVAAALLGIYGSITQSVFGIIVSFILYRLLAVKIKF